jgi:hypothetical protein
MKYEVEKTSIDNLEHYVSNRYERVYFDNGESGKLKGIVPILDDGEVSEVMIVSEIDTHDRRVTLSIDGEEIDESVTEFGYNQMMACNKITYNDSKYLIEDKIFNIDNEEVTLILKRIE